MYGRCHKDFHYLFNTLEKLSRSVTKTIYEIVYFQTYTKSQDWKKLNIEKKRSILQNQYLATWMERGHLEVHPLVELVEKDFLSKPLFIKECMDEALDEYFDELKTLNMPAEFKEFHQKLKRYNAGDKTDRIQLKARYRELMRMQKQWGIEKVEKLYTHHIFTE